MSLELPLLFFLLCAPPSPPLFLIVFFCLFVFLTRQFNSSGIFGVTQSSEVIC